MLEIFFVVVFVSLNLCNPIPGIPELNEHSNVADKACEIYSKFISLRIIDGELVDAGELPWMAALGYLYNTSDHHVPRYDYKCSGSLISELFVLTAAHCTAVEQPPVVVQLGKVSLMDETNITNAKLCEIEHILNHPNYSPEIVRNDIALVRLKQRIWFTQFIRPACLQTYISDENPDVKLLVSGFGFGSVSMEKNSSSVLRKTELITLKIPECNTILLDYMGNWAAFRNGINESLYCAWDPLNRRDSCFGDSGGPLQIMNPTKNIAKIVGIVSSGIGCATNLPGIYTRVAYYLNWIEENVWLNISTTIE